MIAVSRIVGARSAIAKSIFERIRSNFLWSLAGEVGAKGLLFLSTVYLARVLEVADFGVLSYAQTLVSFFWIAADLGVNMYGAREIARDKSKLQGIVSELLTLRIVSGICVWMIYVLAVYTVFAPSVSRMVYLGASLYLLARAVNTDWVLRGLEEFRYIALGNLVTFGFMMGSMALLVRSPQDGLIAVLLWSCSYILGGISLLIILRRNFGLLPRLSLHPSTLMLHIKDSMHFTVAGGGIALYQSLPLIYMGIIASAYEVGIFSAPFRLIIALTFLFSMMQMSLYPIFSGLYVGDKHRFYKLLDYYTKVSICLGLLIGVIGSAFSQSIIRIIFGEAYLASSGLFQIMIWFAALTSLRVIYNTALAVSGLQKMYSASSVFSIIFFSAIFALLKVCTKFSPATASCVSLVVTESALLILLIVIWSHHSESGAKA